MAPSRVAAVLNGQGMAKAATDSRPPVVTAADEEEKFEASVWGDFFTTYVPPISQVFKTLISFGEIWFTS
jgi:hypothetical protein